MVFRISRLSGWHGLGRMCVAVSLLLSMVLLMGCPRYIPPSQPGAVDKATTLKVDALSLMDKATEPYAQHQSEAEALRRNLEIAYENARAVPNNELSTQMWDILKNPEGNLLGGFLTLWQKKSVLSKAYISDKKLQVGEAFDKIINLEISKPR